MKKYLYFKQTLSTNALAWEMNREKELTEGSVLYTDFQLDGKGQPGNSWEAEDGRNLLFSIVLHPHHVPMDELFLISELVSVSIKDALDKYATDITVKWPNDIYWKDDKLAGILIENSLQGSRIKTVVIGIGLNVNQKKFKSNAPNPVSLLQITGKRQNRKQLLYQICRNIMNMYNEFDKDKIQTEYACSLYRKEGYHTFQADNIQFQAKIDIVQPDGQLLLERENGNGEGFYFKEVQFVI
jgi:BirA family transcriptional regulator, biotin operon repressor / biotin---[acetyl-CoA-carboxylase] ligase